MGNAKNPVKAVVSRWRRVARWLQWTILSLVVILVAARLALPHFVERYVNDKLESLPGYRGRIGDVEISLWRGAYAINNVDVVKKQGDAPVPFFSARKIDFSVEWRELFHGSIVTEIFVEKAKVNFIESPNESQKQTSISNNWVDVVKDLAPFKINRFDIQNGEIWFRDIGSNPTVDLYVTNLFVVATNISNSRNLSTNLPSFVRVQGETIGQGDLDMTLHLNPFAEKPTFVLDLKIEKMDVTALNPFLQARAKVDIQRGVFRVYSQINAADGKFDGYVKPFFEDLKVMDLPEDAKHPLKLIWKTIVAAAVEIFKNHPTDRVATKVPVSGTFDNAKVGVWPTITTLLRNAFIKALVPKFDAAIHSKDEEPDPAGKPRTEPK